MKILRFNESGNTKIRKKALFAGSNGSGYYVLCGSLEDSEFQEAKKIENGFKFKRFDFTVSESIKEVDEYTDSDAIVWKNSWGHLMINESSYLYKGVLTSKFQEYYNLLDKYSDYKYEMLPYFVADCYYGTSKPLVFDFFEKLMDNYSNVEAKCWDGAKIEDVINYIKNSGVYNAYEKLKEILLNNYKFAQYFEDIPKDDRDKADNLYKSGFND